jgi:hypothetical protein
MFQEHYDNKRMEGSSWTSCHHCLWFGQFDKMQGKEIFLGWLLILWSLFKTIHLHATVMFSWFFCSPAFLQKKLQSYCHVKCKCFVPLSLTWVTFYFINILLLCEPWVVFWCNLTKQMAWTHVDDLHVQTPCKYLLYL